MSRLELEVGPVLVGQVVKVQTSRSAKTELLNELFNDLGSAALEWIIAAHSDKNGNVDMYGVYRDMRTFGFPMVEPDEIRTISIKEVQRNIERNLQDPKLARLR